MKVKVNYYALNTAEIEVDDKFADAVPARRHGDYDTYEALVDELDQVLSSQIPSDIYGVDDENGELIYEL